MTNKNEDESRRPTDDTTSLALPGTGFPSIFQDFMRPFDQFMSPFFPDFARSFLTEAGGKQPTIDMQDRGDHYLMTAELPGFDKKDVEVRIEADVLELKAEKTSKEETKSKSGSNTQTSHSYYSRRISLPEEVQAEKVNGTMKNGVLELRLPKKEPKLSRKSRRVDLK
jgi:HSP20 family protein